MCKCCVIKCFPNDYSYVKCCNCYITYKFIFALQTIFTVCFHFFDIGSDIVVLVDLNNNGSEYFTLCLIIILLPVFANFIRMTQTLRRTTLSCGCIFTGFFYFFIYSLLQYNFLRDAKENIRRGANTQGFIETRLRESLLESAPEALFQLFFILKNASTYTYNQMTTYYLSITLSVLSLIMSLVSYEISFHNSTIYLRDLPNRIALKFNTTEIKEQEQKVEKKFNIADSNLKFNSRYVLLLTFYRFTEVISRIGLLACVGIIYDGYVIIWFLLSDFIISFLLFFSKKIYHDCNLFEYEEYNNHDDFYLYCSIRRTFIVNMNRLVERLKNLPVYAYHFLKFIYLLEKNIGRTPEITKELEYRRHRAISKTNFHFTSKIINNCVLSIIIIYNISLYTYTYSLYVISIASISAFLINMPLLYLLKKYIYNYKKYQYIFKPIGCCKCRCCCKNIEDIVDEKHPDDIVI